METPQYEGRLQGVVIGISGRAVYEYAVKPRELTVIRLPLLKGTGHSSIGAAKPTTGSSRCCLIDVDFAGQIGRVSTHIVHGQGSAGPKGVLDAQSPRVHLRPRLRRVHR